MTKKLSQLRLFDFFSGCGGTSIGFAQAGMDIAFALDFDADASATFKLNLPRAQLIGLDIRNVDAEVLRPLMRTRATPVLFCGCAPCQPFSKQNRQARTHDPRRSLLMNFGRFVSRWKPEYIFVENVPGLQNVDDDDGPLSEFTALLEKLGYLYSIDVVSALSYGVPQTRKRLILLASFEPGLEIPRGAYGPEALPASTVRDWIGWLPPIEAGETSDVDPDHRAAQLSKLNLARIKATPEGGGRENWPKRLWLDCHRGYVGHSDVYGRLAWDRPAAGLTTRCISYSNGRFGHPDQNRAISVREAPCLQTFPTNYRFSGSLESKGRQIGNAVPPLMAKAIGEAVMKHAQKYT